MSVADDVLKAQSASHRRAEPEGRIGADIDATGNHKPPNLAILHTVVQEICFQLLRGCDDVEANLHKAVVAIVNFYQLTLSVSL